MPTLILLRHGQSEYNLKNIFTGWTETDLTPQGVQEAEHAAKLLMKEGLYPDICFTSWLERAIHTANIVLEKMQWNHIDQLRSWRINERHYGDWQGRNKDEVLQSVGEEAFVAVRRGYDTPPPLLPSIDDPRSPHHQKKYQQLDPEILPLGESLHQTQIRTLNYYYEAIVPQLAKGKTVLVSAHGNTLRSLLMELKKLSVEEVVELEVPTGRPVVCQFDCILNVTSVTEL
jgi:2,3-bisphosphoglycerate-dependent phosphoglycerate mutase